MEDIFKTYTSVPIVDITIQKKDERGFDKVLGIPDKDIIIFGSVEKVFILENAMTSGKSSTTLYCEVKPGVHVALETSSAILEMITSAVRGVESR